MLKHGTFVLIELHNAQMGQLASHSSFSRHRASQSRRNGPVAKDEEEGKIERDRDARPSLCRWQWWQLEIW